MKITNLLPRFFKKNPHVHRAFGPVALSVSVHQAQNAHFASEQLWKEIRYFPAPLTN
jgi:hypothetical protein